jgi:hypothetical protein
MGPVCERRDRKQYKIWSAEELREHEGEVQDEK